MENPTRRPWESESPPQPQPRTTQTLPSISTLTANMPEKDPMNLARNSTQRESGNWSLPPSARSSTYSANTMPYLNSSHHTPNRLSGPGSSQISAYTTESPAGPSPGYSSSQQNHTLPAIHSNIDSSQHRGSGDFEDSRRSSIDSRVHQGMDKLALGPTSPYASANASQASIVSAQLQRERGIQVNGYRGPRYSAGPLSPLGPRSSDSRGFVAGRVAPPILENPRPEVYSAPVPSAGLAYAFPDPDAQLDKSSKMSRRNSVASSINSSIYTTDSRLPPGQQELPTHHHSLQNRQLQDIMDEPDSPNSTTPYSRTPELRVTHKLAERKRRSEMKDCFELLRARLPPNPNNKSSKWETLQRAIDHINHLETKINQYRLETDKQRQQLSEMDMQIKDMSQQLQRMHQQQGAYQTPPSAISATPLGFGNHYSNGMDSSGDPPRTLPPLMNGAAMQGVQYSDDRR